MDKTVFDNEITRLAHLDEFDFMQECDTAMERLGMLKQKTAFISMVKARRKAIKDAAKAAERAALKAQVQFETGSMVEIARHFVKHDLKDMVFTDGDFWFYDDRCWIKVYDNIIRKSVHGYDGLLCGDGKPIKLDSNRIDSIMRESSSIADQRDFFADAGPGITCLNGVIKFGSNGEAELHPHDPSEKSRYLVNATWQPGPVDLKGSLLGRFLNTSFRYVKYADEYKKVAQEAAGAALTGMATRLIQPKCLIFIGAEANNGKSSLIKLIRMLPSKDAVSHVTPKKFSNEQYRYLLAGKTLNVSDELAPSAMESDMCSNN